MRTLRYVLADVFTDRPLSGNQLAVFTRAEGLDDATMQALAREMNLSETVFVLPPKAGGHAHIRIFTVRQEIPFAGHPVLGTAYILGGPLQANQVRLETGAGLVTVDLERHDRNIRFAWMTQPLPSVRPLPSPADLLGALGVTDSSLPILVYDNGISHTYVEMPSKDAVAALCPDGRLLAKVPVLTVSAFAGGACEYKTRVFVPSGGIEEDAATGSAAGPLAVHLARHGRIPFGACVSIEQGAEIHRPSHLFAQIDGQPDRIDRVRVGGEAVVVGRGEMRVP